MTLICISKNPFRARNIQDCLQNHNKLIDKVLLIKVELKAWLVQNYETVVCFSVTHYDWSSFW